MACNGSFYSEGLPTNLKRLNFGIYQYGQTLTSPISFLLWALHYEIFPKSGK